MSREIAQVKTDYVNGENYTFIDIFFTDDQMEEGKSIGAVCNDTKKVLFFDNRYSTDAKVLEAIKEIKSKL